MLLKDYYAIVGITESATQPEIKTAYRARARKLHPDINHGLETTAKMQELNEAYMVLANAETRMQYDQELLRHRAKVADAKMTAEQTSDYHYFDEDLADKVRQAAETARAMKNEYFEESKKLLVVAGKEAVDSFLMTAVLAGGFLLLVLILAQCSR